MFNRKRSATAPPHAPRAAKRADYHHVSSAEDFHRRMVTLGIEAKLTCTICMDPLASKPCGAYLYNDRESMTVCGECHAECQRHQTALIHGSMELTSVTQDEIAAREKAEASDAIGVKCCCGTVFPLHYGSMALIRSHFDVCPDALANEVLRASDAGTDPAEPLRRVESVNTPTCRRPKARRPDAFVPIAEDDPERFNVGTDDCIVPAAVRFD